MRSTSLFSIFGFALGMSAAIVACSSGDDDTAPAAKSSGLGESCVRTGDCGSGLVCIDDMCQKKGVASTGGNAGNDGTGGSTGGTRATGGTSGGGTGGTATAGSSGKAGTAGSGTTTTTVPPVLGKEGESCTRAADCDTNLQCFNQRCVSEPTGEGGAGGEGPTTPPTVRLGEQGETCTLSSDCEDGLACLPSAGAATIGVCTVVSAGISPTGNDCHAECGTAADCCELPPSLLSDLGIQSCADLADELTGIDCGDPGGFDEECFVQQTYCNCTTTTWKCSDQGACVYNAACSNDGLTTEGCATTSRSDKALVPTCNSGKCQAAAVTATCTKDTDCVGEDVSGSDAVDTCTDGECVCYKAQGLCYRKCGGDLDCAPGFDCDSKTQVCTQAPGCTDDLTCQTKNHNIKSLCMSGACQTTCATDLDCNATLTGNLNQVCNANHVCENIGCTDDSQCSTETVHMFCTPDLTADTTATVESAVTQGTHR